MPNTERFDEAGVLSEEKTTYTGSQPAILLQKSNFCEKRQGRSPLPKRTNRSIMKHISCSLICILSFYLSPGQPANRNNLAYPLPLYVREILIATDTTIEYYNSAKRYNKAEVLDMANGLRITATGDGCRLLNFTKIENAELNGINMEFYLPSNMPKSKGTYFHDHKDGEWFYWRENGKLLRKETWKEGKLINKKRK
ncbi:MAG: hypothetical protein ABW019_10835 [Chitinophagaceae bacterium]